MTRYNVGQWVAVLSHLFSFFVTRTRKTIGNFSESRLVTDVLKNDERVLFERVQGSESMGVSTAAS